MLPRRKKPQFPAVEQVHEQNEECCYYYCYLLTVPDAGLRIEKNPCIIMRHA